MKKSSTIFDEKYISPEGTKAKDNEGINRDASSNISGFLIGGSVTSSSLAPEESKDSSTSSNTSQLEKYGSGKPYRKKIRGKITK